MKRYFRLSPLALLLVTSCLGEPSNTEVVQSALTCAGDVDCNDANPCTDDACDLGMHVCKHFNNNNACNDGSACTVGDICNSGVCLGGNVAASCNSCSAT